MVMKWIVTEPVSTKLQLPRNIIPNQDFEVQTADGNAIVCRWDDQHQILSVLGKDHLRAQYRVRSHHLHKTSSGDMQVLLEYLTPHHPMPRCLNVTVGLDVPVRQYWEQNAAAASGFSLTSPMNGKVLAIHVKSGQTVAAGDKLLTIEAMKMENAILAEHSGIITAINIAEGDVVTTGQVLLQAQPVPS